MTAAMTRALVAVCLLAALAGPAAAEGRVQVLQSDGRADAKIRAKIDAGILALARTSGAQILPGDITFTEAAAAVGCRPEDGFCKDEVLGMLAVDEIVITTVTPKPGGVEVAVKRVGKGGVSREATSFIAHDKLDQLDAIAPLFSTKPATPAPSPVAPPPAAPGGPEITGSATSPAPPPETAPAGAALPPAVTEPRASPIATQPLDPYAAGGDDRPRGRRRLQVAGMVGGGAMLLVGFVLWGSAASVQGEIDAAPVGTKAQLQELQDLEARGDRYAGAGNLFVVGGLVLGGISTYYFVKRGRRPAMAARLVPSVWSGGGGLALSIGGTP
jgi:hypothetical protein